MSEHYQRDGIYEKEQESREAVREADYLLARWRLTISTKGCCWIRPLGAAVSPEELAGFVALFRRCCDAVFPRVVVFDLGHVRVVGEQWSLIFELLHDFARQIGARCRVSCSRRGTAKAVLIQRG